MRSFNFTIATLLLVAGCSVEQNKNEIEEHLVCYYSFKHNACICFMHYDGDATEMFSTNNTKETCK